jgi:hypothetical protein
MRTVMDRKTGRRLLTVAAEADPMEVRSRSVCEAHEHRLVEAPEFLTGSQQHELWRSAENSGATESIQEVISESFGTDLEGESVLLDLETDDFGASQHDAMVEGSDCLYLG